MVYLRSIFAATIIFGLAGCTASQKPPSLTPLEIQSLQTRTYEAPREVVFRSVISVFQDLGYNIGDADTASGLINAEGTAKSNEAAKFWLGITQVSQTKATAFVETINDKTSVRLSFVQTSQESSAYGRMDRSDSQILDAGIYQNAFEKIETAIFVRTAN